MANRYANLPGASKIKDTYDRINQGFDLVEQDVDKLQDEVEYIDDRVDQIISDPTPGKDPELVDIRTVDPSYTPQRTINVAGDVTRDMQAQFVALKAETVQLTGPQTITGEKTFTAPINVRNGKALDMYNPALTVDANRYSYQVQDGVLRLFALSSAGAWLRNLFEFAHSGNYAYFGNGNIKLLHGALPPEGNIAAPSGAFYFKPSQPARLYLKEFGTGNTGWKELAFT